MPVGDFLRVREGLAPLDFSDTDWMLRSLRMVKSAAEIALMRHVCQLVSVAFETLPSYVNAGDTEREVAAKFQTEVFGNGGEKIPYLICTSGRGGYPCINLGPSDHRLEPTDVLIIDTGVSYEGYFCDFDRDYSVGEPSAEIKRAYDAVWRATEAGIAAARPGNKTSDVWRAQAEVLADAEGEEVDREGFGAGRYGHGIGLRMCEPPSNSPVDDQLLIENMTLTIEPGLPFVIDGPNGPERKILVHEENVVVTPQGGELLTRRAPREMPILD
jgi:Xaa-Pro aminopeptidase